MIYIIDYGVGNLASVKNMFKKAGIDAVITSQWREIEMASKILLPGMGHFDNCMIKLNESGLRPVIEQKVFYEKIPVLGICVGLQMFMEESEEGNEKGLGWLKGKTIRFNSAQMPQGSKIPNLGWHEITATKNSPITSGLENARFYFAHSFHVVPDNPGTILLTANYGYTFAAALEHENIIGVQFHPEKSHRFGMNLLENFAKGY